MGSCRHGRSTHEVSASAVPCTAAGILRSSDKRPWGQSSASEGGTSLPDRRGGEQHLCGTWGASKSYAKRSETEGCSEGSYWARAFGERQRWIGGWPTVLGGSRDC